MSLLQQQPWEMRLLTRAHEAFDSQILANTIHADDTLLDAAYRYCAHMTRSHSKTFYIASGLLPKAKRRAARALYAFCRVTDDIADNTKIPTEQRLKMLHDWQRQLAVEHHSCDSPIALAWADTQTRFNIPRGYAQQLIAGVTRDLRQTRYQTFEELAEYSYGVASTVGLMAMHIVGFTGADAIPYAIRLGVALQMTNILRDIGEDWRNGRLYLPAEELAAYDLSEADLDAGLVDARWRAFMVFQIERNRKLYAESEHGIALLDKDGRFAIAAAANLYKAILSDIEANDYNVFERRAHISRFGKVSRLPGIWWRSRNQTIA